MIRGLHFLIAIALASLSTVPAPAQEPPEGRPILRLETGMHTAPIRGAAVDAHGKTLVTVSDDRTARLWSLSTGEPIRTFRPEIGSGGEGRLFTVAAFDRDRRVDGLRAGKGKQLLRVRDRDGPPPPACRWAS